MLPFLVAEAIRRARRHRAEPVRRPTGPATWRLVAAEVAHLARTWTGSPAAVVGVLGVVTAAGVHVSLGPAYPGPVAPAVARWGLAVLVLAATVGLARAVPSRWRDAPRAARGVRIGLAAAISAAAISLVKIGLHEVTPGPVMPAPARWVVVAVTVVAAVVLVVDDTHRAGS